MADEYLILPVCIFCFYMELITIFLISIGLSFDTFAVSITAGLTNQYIRFLQGVRIAITLAFFSAFMTFAGWFLGKHIEPLISNYDHWIAFGLLLILGSKMIYKSLTEEKDNNCFNPLESIILIGIAIATSIDALVVGMSFAFITFNIFWSILIIGVVTFFVSMIGILFGKKAGGNFGKRMEIIGGLILVIIGIKILIEHLI